MYVFCSISRHRLLATPAGCSPSCGKSGAWSKTWRSWVSHKKVTSSSLPASGLVAVRFFTRKSTYVVVCHMSYFVSLYIFHLSPQHSDHFLRLINCKMSLSTIFWSSSAFVGLRTCLCFLLLIFDCSLVEERLYPPTLSPYAQGP